MTDTVDHLVDQPSASPTRKWMAWFIPVAAFVVARAVMRFFPEVADFLPEGDAFQTILDGAMLGIGAIAAYLVRDADNTPES